MVFTYYLSFLHRDQETQQSSFPSSYRDSNVNYQILSVIKQKGKSQDKGYKKTKHAKFSKKRTFLPLDTSAYQRIRNACFSENWRALFSCNLCLKIRPFFLITAKARLYGRISSFLKFS